MHISHTLEPVTLVRRDLFDVRFQIIHSDGQFADAHSDLIPGVYEGGLKTWECSLDLVADLDKARSNAARVDISYPRGKHIVEVRLCALNSAWLWNSNPIVLRAKPTISF